MYELFAKILYVSLQAKFPFEHKINNTLLIIEMMYYFLFLFMLTMYVTLSEVLLLTSSFQQRMQEIYYFHIYRVDRKLNHQWILNLNVKWRPLEIWWIRT